MREKLTEERKPKNNIYHAHLIYITECGIHSANMCSNDDDDL